MPPYPIAGDWSYTPMHGGVVIQSPDGAEVFFQPGDGAASIFDTIEALDEIEDEARRAVVADMVFGDYFY